MSSPSMLDESNNGHSCSKFITPQFQYPKPPRNDFSKLFWVSFFGGLVKIEGWDFNLESLKEGWGTWKHNPDMSTFENTGGWINVQWKPAFSWPQKVSKIVYPSISSLVIVLQCPRLYDYGWSVLTQKRQWQSTTAYLRSRDLPCVHTTKFTSLAISETPFSTCEQGYGLP